MGKYGCLYTKLEYYYISSNNLEVKKVQTLLKNSLRIISFTLIISITIFSSENFAQNGLTVFDQIGGSGSNTTQSDESNDDTFLYVAGGLLIAGILVYALVINKDKKTEDTTASKSSNLILPGMTNPQSANLDLQKVKDKIPVDLFMGIKNNQAVMNDKTYLLGLRVKL